MSASDKKKLRKEQSAAAMTEKQLAEQKEAKKLKTYTVTFAIVMVLVVCIGIGSLIWQNVANSGIIERNTTALTVGEHKISSVELNYYYVDAVISTYNDWYNTYGDYTSYLLGLDITQPLDEQVYNAEAGTTWADFFTELAIENVKSTYALCDKAAADGDFALTEAELASVDTGIANMSYSAILSGYADLESYIRASYGPGANEETFREYYEATIIASSYQNAHYETLDYTDEDLRAYDAEHAAEYNAYTYTSAYLDVENFLSGGNTDDEGNITFSEEEQTAAVDAAKAAAESLLKADSVVTFDKFYGAIEFTTDPTSTETTKSEEIPYASVNTVFRDWVTDSSRKAGDVKMFADETTTTADDGTETTTTYGYYVVIFEGSHDNTQYFAPVDVRHILVQFEGGTEDESGNTVYSDADRQAAYDEAAAILDEWKAGEANEESFITLAGERSDDSSASTGGLISGILPTSNLVEEFLNWSIVEHEAGDTGIVESVYGYHVMYYVGAEQNYRDYLIKNQLSSDDMTEWYDSIVQPVTATVGDTSKLARDLVIYNYVSY